MVGINLKDDCLLPLFYIRDSKLKLLPKTFLVLNSLGGHILYMDVSSLS